MRDCDTITVTGQGVWSSDPSLGRQPPGGGYAIGRDRRVTTELLTLDELTERVGMSVRNVALLHHARAWCRRRSAAAARATTPPTTCPARAGPGAAGPRLHPVGDREVRRRRSPTTPTPEDIALHRTMLAPWQAERPVEMPRASSGHARRPHRSARRASPRRSPTTRGIVPHARARSRGGRGLPARGRARAARPRLPARGGAWPRADVYAAHGREIAEELYDAVPDQGLAGLQGVGRLADRVRPRWSTTTQAAVDREPRARRTRRRMDSRSR